ncbi:MAG: SUMF1/EgtB/PvdO family nonheme iron enzyme [Bacteroidales bacterium]|nr:SUMF1/EgtB/PvdO family nonheme iron enzyme [Bacteroidales bacterium]
MLAVLAIAFTMTSCKGGGKKAKTGGEAANVEAGVPGVETKTFTVEGVTFKMVKVEGGTYTMGATAEQGATEPQANERPAHEVTVGDFWIGETEVTQALWEAVTGFNPSYTRWPECPVDKVSWKDCKSFLETLNELTGLEFRLPAEAEWEYAARGGKFSKGYKYAGSDNIEEVAWLVTNAEEKSHPVASKKPNELGLYDMSGNVYEWCEDKYLMYDGSEPQYSQKMLKSDIKREFHIERGGCWNYGPTMCRVSYRHAGNYTHMYAYDGMRLAMSVKAE